MKLSRPFCLAGSLVSLLLLYPAALLWQERFEPSPIDPRATLTRTEPATAADDVTSLRTDAHRAGYTAAAGTRVHYDVDLQLGISLTSATDQAAPPSNKPIVIAVDGSLQHIVLGRRDDEVLVGYRAEGLRVSVPAGTQPETAAWCADLERTLRQGFDTRMDGRGRPVAMRFLGEWTVEQRNFARGLMNAFRFEFHGDGTWPAQFDDTMGHHTFDYRAAAEDDDVALVRTRTGFVPKGAETDPKAAVELNGRGEARFVAAVAWLTTASIEDALAWSWIDGALRVSSWLRGTLQFTHADAIDVTANWQDGFVDVAGAHEAPTAASDPMRHLWDEKLGGLDVTAVLQRLQAFLDSKQEPGQQYQELLQMLAELVRRDPAEAGRLAELVQSAQLTGQSAADVLAALGMAGHEQAQAALAAVFENGLVEPALRQAAVESMFQVEHPEQQLVDSLRRSLHGIDQLAGLQGSAMLALGAFGSRGATTTEGRPLVDELLGLEASARRDGLEGAYFEALGNTGDLAVVPVAQRLLQSSDPLERQQALTVLRRVASPAADELLRSTARNDADADVRQKAVQTIAESTAAWTRDALVESAASDADADVRRVAYSGLAVRAHTDTVARATLIQRLGVELDPDLRQMLQSLLGGA